MARVGRQLPTFEVAGGYHRTDGPEAVAVFEGYGFGFDGAQRHEMDLYLARDERGRPAAITIGLSKPRQNGKSYAARWYAVWCAAICGMSVVYSAHNGDTVSEFFDMLCGVFEDGDAYPDLNALLDGDPYRQPGKQSMRFTSGGRIRFSTRTNNKSRGGTCSVLVIDEAQELTDAQLNALLPTTSASPDGPPQVIYIGTPPDPTCLGTVFQRLHDTAHSEEPGEVWWMEWAVPDLPAETCAPDDLIAMAYETNPAMGVRITERAVRNELASMTRDGFARERLGWWLPGGVVVDRAIDPAKWRACEVPEGAAMTSGRLAYGVKFSTDGKRVALSAALSERGGGSYIELIELAPTAGGTAWLRDWLIERAGRCCAVAVDGKSGASALASALITAGFPRRALIECGPGDAMAAASLLLEEVEGGTVSHIASEAMDESATGSIRRKIGSNGGFGFGDGPDSISTPVESGALALWASRTSKRDPTRKQRVW